MDGMTSASQAGSTASRMSTGLALLQKFKSHQSKIKAKATAISNVIGHSDITSNAKAGIVWSQIEKARCEYQTILDQAFVTLEGTDG